MLHSRLAISILVADDRRMFRQGLLRLFSEDPRFWTLPEVRDGREAWTHIRGARPQVAVLAADLSGMGGLQIAAQAASLDLPTRCIILALRGQRLTTEQVFRTGAAGCLRSVSSFEDLAELACRAADGESHLGGLESPDASPGLPGFGLSRRELEVLRQVSRGLTTKQIAEALFISRYTVDCHRQRIMHKLGVANGPGLVRFAIEHGIC